MDRTAEDIHQDAVMARIAKQVDALEAQVKDLTEMTEKHHASLGEKLEGFAGHLAGIVESLAVLNPLKVLMEKVEAFFARR